MSDSPSAREPLLRPAVGPTAEQMLRGWFDAHPTRSDDAHGQHGPAKKQKTAAAPLTVALRGGTTRLIPSSFVARCATLATMVEDAAQEDEEGTGGGGGNIAPLSALSADELELLLRLHELEPQLPTVPLLPSSLVQGVANPIETALEGMPAPLVAIACRAAGYVGHAEISRGGVRVLCARYCRASHKPEMPQQQKGDADAVCGIADVVPPELQMRLQALVADPSVEALREVGAAVRAARAAAAHAHAALAGPATPSALEILDFDSTLQLLSGLDTADALRVVRESSLSVCALAVETASGGKASFLTWAAVLQQPRSSSSWVQVAVDEVVDSLSREHAGGDVDGGGGRGAVGCWERQVLDLISLSSRIERFARHVQGDGADDAIPDTLWIEQQASRLHHPDPLERLTSRMFVPHLANWVHRHCTAKPSRGEISQHDRSGQLYDSCTRILGAAAEAACRAASDAMSCYQSQGGISSVGGSQRIAVLHERASMAWQRCMDAHKLQCVIYAYLENFYLKRENRMSLEDVCRNAMADGPWQELESKYEWKKPAPVVVASSSSSSSSSTSASGGAAAPAATDAAAAAAAAGSAAVAAAGGDPVVVPRPEVVELASDDGQTFSVRCATVCQMGTVAQQLDAMLATGGLPADGTIPIRGYGHFIL
jgi:hypothetical protein